MSTAYTPGEWFTSRPTPHGTVYIEARLRPGTLQEVAACGPTEAPEQREANARRIVSCVNALDGLPQEALDGGWTAKGASAYAKRLESINAELLAALDAAVKDAEQPEFEIWLDNEQPSGDAESVRRQWESSSEYRSHCEHWKAPLDAIARARGEA